MEIIVIGRFSIAISAILVAILILKKPRGWRVATRAKFQAYSMNCWKMQRNDF